MNIEPPSQRTDATKQCLSWALHRRWWFWAIVVPVAAMILPVGIHRGLLEYRCAQIRRAGGTVGVGPPPIYHELAYTTRAPQPIRELCYSDFGRWCFEQIPIVYSVDLRGVSDPNAVESALEAAKSFPRLSQLTLYQSGIKDNQLAMLPASHPRLTHLWLNETDVTDQGLRHLQGLRRLAYVNVQRTAITDESVPILADFPRLKVLAVGETGITSVELIRKNRPVCKIHTAFLYATRCLVCRRLLNECRCEQDKQASDDG